MHYGFSDHTATSLLLHFHCWMFSADMVDDNNCMKFPLTGLPVNTSRTKPTIEQLSVSIYIAKKSRKKKSKKRIQIRVSILRPNGKKKLLKRLKVTIFKQGPGNWFQLPLPSSIIPRKGDADRTNVQLCITCKRCSRKIALVLPLKQKKKRRKTSKPQRKRLRPRKLQNNRPLLYIRYKPGTQTTRPRRSMRSEK
jgi:hypothetical protein